MQRGELHQDRVERASRRGGRAGNAERSGFEQVVDERHPLDHAMFGDHLIETRLEFGLDLASFAAVDGVPARHRTNAQPHVEERPVFRPARPQHGAAPLGVAEGFRGREGDSFSRISRSSAFSSVSCPTRAPSRSSKRASSFLSFFFSRERVVRKLPTSMSGDIITKSRDDARWVTMKRPIPITTGASIAQGTGSPGPPSRPGPRARRTSRRRNGARPWVSG